MGIGAAVYSFQSLPHCGDQWGCWQEDTRTILCIVDGLGHGLFAEQAAKAAIVFVEDHLALPLPDIFHRCNRAIRHTWGAGMGIAVIEKEAATLTYGGIGNTRIRIIRDPGGFLSVRSGSADPMGDSGIVGGGFRKLSTSTVPFGRGDLVIMYTDGVRETIDLSGYDPSLFRDMQRLAERIIKDWGRENDDAAVLAYRYD